MGIDSMTGTEGFLVATKPKKAKVSDLKRLLPIIERAKEMRGNTIGINYTDGDGGFYPFPEILEAFMEHLDNYAKDHPYRPRRLHRKDDRGTDSGES